MIVHAAKRLLSTIPGIGMVALIVFAILRLTPGDPAAILAGDMSNQEQIADSRQLMGLDQPIYVQFFSFDVGCRGRDAGRQINLGPSALLRLDGSGLLVVVTSLGEQPADPRHLEMFGVDIAKAKCIVLKSRGHFRASFDEYFAFEQLFELDSPGLTSNVLTNFKFRKLIRPIWPLDAETTWRLPDTDA